MMGIALKPLEKCRVCGVKLQLIEKMNRIPLEGSRFSKDIIMPEFYNSLLYLCPECGLYQMPDIENFSDFYNFSNTKYIKSLNSEREEKFNELLSLTKARNSILGIEDVGFTDTVNKYFQKSITIAPQGLCKEGFGEDNHFILRECLLAGTGQKNSFDAFYIICLLAHVDNPLRIMQDIKTLLTDGGVGWIEVLNGKKLVDKGQYYMFMPILLNYWTPHSLSMLLKHAGLETMMIQQGLEGDHLNVFFKKPVKRPLLMENRDKQIDAILGKASKYKSIVVWGAGAKAHYLFGYMSNALQVSHIVDGNPEKTGLYMPGAQVPIERPSKELFLKADCVIIFAAFYEKEITRTLREKYLFQGEIMSISDVILSPPPPPRWISLLKVNLCGFTSCRRAA